MPLAQIDFVVTIGIQKGDKERMNARSAIISRSIKKMDNMIEIG